MDSSSTTDIPLPVEFLATFTLSFDPLMLTEHNFAIDTIDSFRVKSRMKAIFASCSDFRMYMVIFLRLVETYLIPPPPPHRVDV